jgi:GxxExxY protein
LAEAVAEPGASALSCGWFKWEICKLTSSCLVSASSLSSTSPFSTPEILAHETREMTRKEEKPELIYKDESYAIIGACFAVYRDKGCGFHEPVYHECLEIELEFLGIPFLSKPPQTLQYRGRTLVQTFSPDFICYEKIIFEIKALSALVDEHRAQILNYLAATGCKLGLLVNFGHFPRLEYERLLPRQHEPADLHL